MRIVCETREMEDEPGRFLAVRALRVAGELLPVRERRGEILFVGDSLTCGEGTVGAAEEQDWLPAWSGFVHGLSRRTAEALDLEGRLIARSGWGVYSDWQGERQNNLGRLIASLPRDPAAEEAVEIAVIHLGTNDAAAGTDPALVQEAGIRLLEQVRERAPRAQIFWAYGMLGDALAPALQQMVRRYVDRSGDRRVHFVPLPDTKENELGALRHPGAAAHGRAAGVLTAAVRAVLSEEKEY